MDHVGPAVVLAQALIRRADVEEHLAAGAPCIGGAQQRIGGEVRQHDRGAPVCERVGSRRRVLAFLEFHLVQREMLIEELAGGIVVINRRLRPRDPIVLGRYLNQRDRNARFFAAQIADLELEQLSCARSQHCQKDDGCRYQSTRHG